MTSTFAGIVTAFCRALNWQMLALIISQFQERLFFGIHHDLIDLMKISILNSQRARALHSAGFETLIDLAKANRFAVEQCLHNCISFDSKIRDGENNYEAEKRNEERSVFVTGKSGLTVKEAAEIIVVEARAHLEKEMKINNINWTTSSGNEESEQIDVNAIRGNDEELAAAAGSSAQTASSVPVSDTNENEIDAEAAITSEPPNDSNSTTQQTIQPADDQQNVIESEDEDHDIISFNETDPVKSELLNTSHLLNDSKFETKAAQFNHISIVDVCKNQSYFSKFEEDVGILPEYSISLAIDKVDPSRKNVAHRCALTDGAYIGGIAVCIDSNVAFYLSLQDGDDTVVPWKQRLMFVKTMLSRKELLLKCLDAKDQLKALLKGLPEIENVCCSIEDPKVAHWLLQPDTESSLIRMVRT